jgi:MoxR-like ATPase
MTVSEQFQQLEAHVSSLIVGQSHLINRMLIALLCDGHLLVEGAPGLAKTRAIKVLAESIEGSFHRLQFTPDLLPADLTGTDIYRPQDGTFEFRKGPLFHNLILADEINRAPAKVQSALLEAMEERQITVGEGSYKLPDLFMVMATQNPIEQEGTYPLPEAQLDRFLLHVQVGYPTPEDERKILILNRNEARSGERDAFAPPTPMPESVLMDARQQILNMHLSDELEQYIVNVVVATRNPGAVNKDLEGQVMYGASPRACMGIDRASRAHAWLQGRDYVGPEDIQEVASDVLRHRLVMSFEAEADGVLPDSVIEGVLDGVGVP